MSGRGRHLLALVVLLALYLLVRLPHLGVLPPFDDESNYVWDALLIAAAVRVHAWGWLFISLHDGVPPLFPWLLSLGLGLPLDPIVLGRLLSVLAGAATTTLLYLTGGAWGSRRAGLIAGSMYIISPYALFTDRIGLLDGMLALWSILGAVLVWQGCSTAGQARAARWGAAAGLAFGAALLTKSLGLLGLLAPALALWAQRRRGAAGDGAGSRSRWLAVEVAYVVAACTWSVVLASGQVTRLLYPFGLQSGVARAPGGMAGRVPGTAAAVAGYAASYLTLPLAVALAAALLWTLWRGRPPARYLAWWIVLATAALIATAGPFFPPRYLAIRVPPLFLCGALAADRLMEWCGPRRGGVALALLGLVALPAALAFDAALLLDPSRAPLPAVDRAQYIAGWPAGYGLLPALAEVRRLSHDTVVLNVFGATNPPFAQAHVTLRDTTVRIDGVVLETALPCRGTVTLALLDEPRDAEDAFRRANPRWQRLAAYPRPGQGGAYVLFRCPTPGRR
ncbi:MAG: hypothetical protein NVSMB65_03830 [Chloroflexota bacterium]